MIKPITIRPHHFLCLPGYKGLNYDQTAKTSWDTLSKLLRENPNTNVKIVSGSDSLCLNCPKRGENCTETTVKKLDQVVKKLLNLRIGGIYIYKEIDDRLRGLLDPAKHTKICGDCFWRAYGVCRDTFQK